MQQAAGPSWSRDRGWGLLETEEAAGSLCHRKSFPFPSVSETHSSWDVTATQGPRLPTSACRERETPPASPPGQQGAPPWAVSPLHLRGKGWVQRSSWTLGWHHAAQGHFCTLSSWYDSLPTLPVATPWGAPEREVRAVLPPPAPGWSLAPNQPLGCSAGWVRSATGASPGSTATAPWSDCKAHAAIAASLVGARPACPWSLVPEHGAHGGLDQARLLTLGFAKDVNCGNMVRAFGHLCPGQGH